MLQSGKINLEHAPDEIQIEREVAMRDAIAEVGDVALGNVRVAISEVGGEFAGRLGQRFESIQRGVLDEVVGQEGVTAGRRPLLNEFDALQDVVEVTVVSLPAHSGTASRRMRSATCWARGDKVPRSSTTSTLQPRRFSSAWRSPSSTPK